MRETKGIRVHHNLVKRTRQSGLSGDEVYHNEVYVESWAPNAFGLAGKRIYGNRVFGTGHHVCAIGWGGVREVYNNYVHLEAEEPVARYTRARASMNGMRFTLYGEGTQECAAVVYHDNIVVVAARDGGQARGLQFSTGTKAAGRIFRNNTVKALARDHTSDQTCVVAEGNPKLADQHLPMVYANTTFIGTTVHLRLGGGNPPGSNHQFHNCRFVKVGDDPRYTTLLFPSGYASKNHVFRDCTFEGGASLDSVRWANDRADHGFTVQWTLTVRTAPDARVTITDKAGKEVFSGSADGVGVAAVPLSQYVARPADKTFYTPHQVKVEKDGKTVTKTVTMDAKQEVEIGL